jgi:hypothetical protein
MRLPPRLFRGSYLNLKQVFIPVHTFVTGTLSDFSVIFQQVERISFYLLRQRLVR